MDLGLDGKAAIVTGASKGLGLAIVEALLAEGTRVVAAARSEGGIAELRDRDRDQFAYISYDAREEGGAQRLVDSALAAMGRVDVLVNNAGIAPAGRFVEVELEVWRDVLEVNVIAPVALTRAVGPHMLERGSGKVVNVASLTGLRGKGWLSAYSASKGALVRFTEAIAAEWAPAVQVNTIAPGAFRTEAQQAVFDSAKLHDRRVAKIPAERFGESAEIGPLACYLASEASDFVTGATFVIDGGELSKL
jgi:2-deoxy-D-gluconate 3-dehydrogenase